MDKAKKANIKRVIALVCAVAVVALLAALPLIAKQEKEDDGPQASILSGTVGTGSIDTEVMGGGTLAEEDAAAVSVPAAVKLKEFLVANGDTVEEGTTIATVDRVSVMQAISQVQETLEHLSEQIEEAGDTADEKNVTALAGGTVKILYAQPGDSVQSVMLEHGALAVLSLDGLMAVDMAAETELAVGAAVNVTLSDGTVAEGKVVKNLAGELTVTVEDDAYTVGDAVQVADEAGNAVGSGELYIYNPWKATEYTGTVESVKVSVGDTLGAGKTLMRLNEVGYSAAYRQLIGQRQEYEELMLKLFKMYQTETLTAPCAGVVSGIEKNSIQLLAATGQSYTVALLANAPNGDDATLYSNYVATVTGVANNGWAMNVNPQAVLIEDYLNLAHVNLDEALMTQSVLHTQTEIPVFAFEAGAWVQIDRATIAEGDVLLFAADSQGNLVWSVLLKKAVQQPDGSGDSDASDQPDNPGENTNTGTPTVPGGMGSAVSRPSFGGGFTGGGILPEEETAFELYSLEMVQVAAVTPQNTVQLDIAVDELDVKALQIGMAAQVKINALGGEKYAATITDIGNVGTNNGGSSKYTVSLTMDRAKDMLPGMNATATIVLATASDILTVPAEALVENGNTTVVYTAYDEETESLLNPVEVKIGSCDGKTAQILDGLVNGQTYYYAYYDTLEISYTPDFGGGFIFG